MAIVGWRAWAVCYKDGEVYLRSPIMPSLWDGPVYSIPTHEKEGLDIALDPSGNGRVASFFVNGIYAYRARQRRYSDCLSPEFFVTGWGHGYGKVAVHKLGFRAEKFMIQKLFVGRQLVIHTKESGPWNYQYPPHQNDKVLKWDIVQGKSIPIASCFRPVLEHERQNIIRALTRRYQCVVKTLQPRHEAEPFT